MLRHAIPADLENIQTVLNRPDNLDKLEGYPDRAILAAIADAGSKVLIWEEDQHWRGFCWLTLADAEVKIEEFGVLAPGRGAGSRFFAAVLKDHYRANPDARLWLAVAGDNARAIRFYERFGFVAYETKPKAWARRKGPVADAILMHHRA